MELYKYPRTYHIEGSGLQKDDDKDNSEPFESLLGKALVIEEKMEGSNSAVSFDNGKLLLQSRGHYLSGGPKEAQFSMFKTWAWERHDWLKEKLEDRYVMYGECLSFLHTIFYNNLPDLFMEFDMYDKEAGEWLSTFRRKKLLFNKPTIIHPVRVLFAGKIKTKEQLISLIGDSPFIIKETWEDDLKNECLPNRPFEKVIKEVDKTKISEGLYIKVEGGPFSNLYGDYNVVEERYKFVRKDFLDAVKRSESHWFGRPLIKNIIKKP